jgi:drug/metabolite transporter (DMT)-like permease
VSSINHLADLARPDRRRAGGADGPLAPKLSRRSAYAVLFVMILLLGSNWPVMAIALESFTPLWMSVFRLSSAAATLFAVGALRRNVQLPTRADVPVMFSIAFFRLGIATALVFIALQFVPPGRSSILVYTSALWAVPISAMFLKEHPPRIVRLGLGIGILGIVLLFEPWRFDWSDEKVLIGHVLLLLSAIIVAFVTVHIQAHDWHATPLDLFPWQLAGAALLTAVVALVVDGPPAVEWSLPVSLNILYQGVFVSGIGTWGEITVSRSLPIVTMHVGLIGVPAVGLISSVLVVGEVLTPAVLISLALVALSASTSAISEWRDAASAE